MQPADHVSLALLAQVFNGIKRYRNVHFHFLQIVATITSYINGKSLRNSSLKYVEPRIRLLALQKFRGAEEYRAAVTCIVPDSPLEDLLSAKCVLLSRAKISK